MSLPDGQANGMRPGPAPLPARGARPGQEALPRCGSPNRPTALGLVLCAAVGALDVAVGHGNVLAGLLIMGLGCGVLTGRRAGAEAQRRRPSGHTDGVHGIGQGAPAGRDGAEARVQAVRLGQEVSGQPRARRPGPA